MIHNTRQWTIFHFFVEFEEGDSDTLKGSVQTRHTQTTISSLEQKNYRQEGTYN